MWLKSTKDNTNFVHLNITHSSNDPRIKYRWIRSLEKKGIKSIFVAHKNANSPDKDVHHHFIPDWCSNKFLCVIFNLFIIFKNLNKKNFVLHNLELLLLAPFLKICGKRVIYDVHEDFRSYVLQSPKHPKHVRYLISNIIKFYELILVSIFCNSITCATSTIKKNYVKSRKYLLPNFPLKEMFSGIKKSHSSKKIVAYVGTLSKQKGFHEMLEIAKLCQDDDNIQFIFAGKYTEPDIKNALTKPEKNTTYLGEVDQTEIVKLLMNSDIGLCLLHDTKSYTESMPLKIFEYINSETFVIASNFRNWEFLEKKSVGKIFQYNDLKVISLFIKGFSSFNNLTTRYYFDDYINLFLEKEFYENSNYL